MNEVADIINTSKIEYSFLNLYDVDLSVERALSLIDPKSRHNYEAMYRWFISNTEAGRDFGSREYGKGQRLPGVDSDFAHAAQRGIHVPSQQKYAATITMKRGSFYGKQNLDGQLEKLPDSTWLLSYAAHRNNADGETDPTWNECLKNCYKDGIPVGVFIESKNNYYRALAFIEDYDENAQVFLLHGPITSTNLDSFSAPIKADAELLNEEIDIEALKTDARTKELREVYRREGQAAFRKKLISAYSGKCAISEGSVETTLQAAHILRFRGEQSNAVSNGLLLRADIHLLYDANLLSINPETLRVDLNPQLSGTEYERFADQMIQTPIAPEHRPNEALLAINYSKFKESLAV